jgi:hypothetical protein
MRRTNLICLLIAILMVAVLSGCGENAGSSGAKLDMQALYQEIEAGVALQPMAKLEGDRMYDYCGINPDNCVQSEVYICKDGLITDEIWLLEAKDDAALKELQAAADNRLKAKAAEIESYSPVQYQVVQKAEVLTNGNYFVMFVSPDVSKMVDIYNAAIS